MQTFFEFSALFLFYSLFAFSILVALMGLINLVFIKKPIIYDQSKNSVLVSVLIPARNEEVNIKRCIYSLIDQSYKNLEIIILDDDSSDQTFEIAQELAKKFQFINVVKGEKNQKVGQEKLGLLST